MKIFLDFIKKYIFDSCRNEGEHRSLVSSDEYYGVRGNRFNSISSQQDLSKHFSRGCPFFRKAGFNIRLA